MSLLDRARELEDISDAQLAQLVQQGSEAGDTWLAATETQRRQDMRKRYAAEAAKQQAANPPSVLEQRAAELGGGIPSADPNMQGPDPSLQTGIAGPPPGMARGGLIRGYQQGGEIDDPYTQISLEEMLDSDYGGAFDPDVRFRGPYRGGIPDALLEASERSEAVAPAGHQRRADLARLGAATSAYEEFGTTGEAQVEMKARARELERLIHTQRGRGRSTAPATAQEREYRAELDEIKSTLASMSDFPIPMEGGMILRATAGPASGTAPSSISSSGLPDDVIASGRWDDPDDELTGTLEEIRRMMGEPGSQMGTQAGAFGQAEGAIGNFLDAMGESPEDLEWDRLRRFATAEDRRRAGGIHSLEQGRIQEQERLLADRLGMSEERIAELMREMDTPEEVESRRKGRLLGALGSTLMGSPTGLGAGFERTGDKLAALDDLLREERKTALGDIYEQREAGAELEGVGRKGIFDLTRSSQKALDTADAAIDNMEATIGQARSERGRRGQADAMRGYVDLFKAKAQQIGAWNSTMAQVDAQMRTAIMNRENQMADIGNWEAIVQSLADIGSSSMMENPDFADWFKNVNDLVMVSQLEKHEDESRSLSDQTAPPTAVSSRVQTRGPGGFSVASRSGRTGGYGGGGG